MVILGLYSIKTIARNAVWKNDFTLYTEDINHSQGSAKAHDAVANQYSRAGERSNDPIKRADFFNRAIDEEKKAVAIYPRFTTAYYTMAVAYLNLNDINAAEPNLRKAIAITPYYVDALNNLGYCFIQQNKLDSAIILFLTAAKQDSTYFRPYENLGAAYSKKKDYEKSYYYFQKAHSFAPNDESVNRALTEVEGILQNSR